MRLKIMRLVNKIYDKIYILYCSIFTYIIIIFNITFTLFSLIHLICHKVGFIKQLFVEII